ncbi:MAG: glycosyltransferase [Nitrospira sp.]|nr:glycosyltransferase [Nitrospira sp.]
MTPTVTVIIGTFNRAGLLREAIKSVLGQTYEHWELLVVDNGSTDDTKATVRSFDDARIRYIRNPKPTGSCAAPRNLGTGLASGDYIAFLDDDDVWYPDKLQVCVKELQAHPEAILVCHALKMVNGSSASIRRFGPWSQDMYERLLYEGNLLGPGGMVIKKEALVRAGGFNIQEEYLGCDDYELWIRLARNRVLFHFIDDVLAEFRVTGSNGCLADPYHSVRLAAMVKTHIMLFEGQSVLSPRGKGRIALLSLLVLRRLLGSGNWRDAAPFIRELVRCGRPGLRRIGAELGSQLKSRVLGCFLA